MRWLRRRDEEIAQQGIDPNLALYVIGFAGGRFPGIVKIGVTNNLKKRLRTLQTGNPWPLQVMACVYRPDAFQLEAYLHRHFDDIRMRPDGEWFQFPPDSDPPQEIADAGS